jgi:hypothetical protein
MNPPGSDDFAEDAFLSTLVDWLIEMSNTRDVPIMH